MILAFKRHHLFQINIDADAEVQVTCLDELPDAEAYVTIPAAKVLASGKYNVYFLPWLLYRLLPQPMHGTHV